jgi:hypothetical protein
MKAPDPPRAFAESGVFLFFTVSSGFNLRPPALPHGHFHKRLYSDEALIYFAKVLIQAVYLIDEDAQAFIQEDSRPQCF